MHLTVALNHFLLWASLIHPHCHLSPFKTHPWVQNIVILAKTELNSDQWERHYRQCFGFKRDSEYAENRRPLPKGTQSCLSVRKMKVHSNQFKCFQGPHGSEKWIQETGIIPRQQRRKEQMRTCMSNIKACKFPIFHIWYHPKPAELNSSSHIKHCNLCYSFSSRRIGNTRSDWLAKGNSTQNHHQNTDQSHQTSVKRTGGWGLERAKEKRRAVRPRRRRANRTSD